jgi:hypothetical protein
MAKTQTRPWDAADHLKTVEDMVAYLEAALEDGDPTLVTAVLGDVAGSDSHEVRTMSDSTINQQSPHVPGKAYSKMYFCSTCPGSA